MCEENCEIREVAVAEFRAARANMAAEEVGRSETKVVNRTPLDLPTR